MPKTLYHLIGEMTVKFSSLEHSLIDLLEYFLVEKEVTLIKPYILDDINVSTCINKLFAISELRLSNHKKEYNNLKKFLNDINEFRQKRNIYIHGLWDDTDENSSYRNIYSFKPKFDKSDDGWTYLKIDRVTPQTLIECVKNLNSYIERLKIIKNEIFKLKLR